MMGYRNTKRKNNYKSLKIKDADLIEYIEARCKDENENTSDIVEELLWRAFTGDRISMKESKAQIIIDRIGSGQIIDALLNNGYTLHIQPVAGKTEMFGTLQITFERKER